MWSKAFESREVISHLKGFFLPPVTYCNLEIRVCQGLENIFPLPKYLGAINKEKGSVRNLLVSGQIFVCKALTYTPKVYIIVGVKIMYAFRVYKY